MLVKTNGDDFFAGLIAVGFSQRIPMKIRSGL